MFQMGMTVHYYKTQQCGEQWALITVTSFWTILSSRNLLLCAVQSRMFLFSWFPIEFLFLHYHLLDEQTDFIFQRVKNWANRSTCFSAQQLLKFQDISLMWTIIEVPNACVWPAIKEFDRINGKNKCIQAETGTFKFVDKKKTKKQTRQLLKVQ